MSKHIFPVVPRDFFKLMLPLFLFACQKQVTQKSTADEYARQLTNNNALKPGAFDKWSYEVNNVRTLVGTTFGGFADGAGNMAQFNSPLGLAQDAAGNIYIADKFNNRIRKMAPDGTVTTLAGTNFGGYKDGPGATAQFEYPTGVAVDSRGYIYVTDQGNNRIRMITPDGVVSTVAGTGVAGFIDGPGNVARFKAPSGIAVDPAGVVYIADQGNNRIRRISTAGIVNVWVGDGVAGYKDAAGAYAELNGPTGLAVGPKGEVYVADAGNNRLRKIVSGVISTLAGSGVAGFTDGAGTAAQFNTPFNVAVDGAGNILVTDIVNGAIREVTPAGVVKTLFGKGGRGIADGWDPAGKMYSPSGIIVDPKGDVTITDDNLIRKMTAGQGVGTFLGSTRGNQDGTGVNAKINYPGPIVFDASGNMYISDGGNRNIRKVTPAGVSTILAGSSQFNSSSSSQVSSFQPFDILAERTDRTRKIAARAGTLGYGDGVGTAAIFDYPDGIAVDPGGNVYVVDRWDVNIRKITPNGVVTTIAGGSRAGHIDGPGKTAAFSWPTFMTRDTAGNLYVSDLNYIRKIDVNYVVSTLAVIPQIPDQKGLYGLSFGADGNLYVNASYYQASDTTYRSEIWKVTPTGQASIFARLPVNSFAYGLTYDTQAHCFYVSELQYRTAAGDPQTVFFWELPLWSQIMRVNDQGQVSVFAGAETGLFDGEISFARFGFGSDIAIGPNNVLYVSDAYNSRIRMVGK